MYLSDGDIKKALKAGEIVINGFDEARLQPASYDILLGNKFIVHNTQSITAIDPVNKIYPDSHEILVEADGQFILHPGISVLGTSVDYFGSEKYLVHLSGKSSLARIGLIIHNTAGIINPGHFLNITFELCNLNQLPIILRPNMRIGQILFSKLSSAPLKDYKTTGRYFGRDWQHFADPRESEKVPGTPALDFKNPTPVMKSAAPALKQQPRPVRSPLKKVNAAATKTKARKK